MYRTDVVIRAALPMGVLNVLLWLAIRQESVGMLLIFGFPLVAYFGGAAAARKLSATWREIVLGFTFALAPLLVLEPALVFSSVMLGATGLFLLPQLSPAVRNADESAKLPQREVLSTALGVLTALILIGSRYMPFPQALVWTFLMSYQCFFPVALVAGMLSVSRSHSRAGAWVGAVGAVDLGQLRPRAPRPAVAGLKSWSFSTRFLASPQAKDLIGAAKSSMESPSIGY